ncbi:MAG: CarD family transcriptional regulator [Vulcanimicrobiota bacterium]
MRKYQVGQKVMHPLHGIGTVEKIEEKKILGKTSKFSVINFTDDRLKIMVNLDQKSMIRGLTSRDEIKKVLDVMKNKSDDMPARSSERYNLNMKKIKSADVFQMAEVIRDLSELLHRKKLSRKEQTMLKAAKKIFCSEVSYVKKISEEEAETLIDDTVKPPQVEA